jgi:hypothetical protein
MKTFTSFCETRNHNSFLETVSQVFAENDIDPIYFTDQYLQYELLKEGFGNPVKQGWNNTGNDAGRSFGQTVGNLGNRGMQALGAGAKHVSNFFGGLGQGWNNANDASAQQGQQPAQQTAAAPAAQAPQAAQAQAQQQGGFNNMTGSMGKAANAQSIYNYLGQAMQAMKASGYDNSYITALDGMVKHLQSSGGQPQQQPIGFR